jgi:hypothetical protein
LKPVWHAGNTGILALTEVSEILINWLSCCNKEKLRQYGAG